ncbi:MAG: discoidin domain-containing protein [Prevotella sp.]|nr:discoidin domain-containing protein [Prevotella sp.]
MKSTILKQLLLLFVLAAGFVPLAAQQQIKVGKGSYASYSPLSKSRSSEHGGDQSRYMQYRTLNIREADDRPIPTNDWWTNLINGDDKHSGRELTGHLWSYPQYVQGMRYGLDIHYPKYWVDNGTEMKAQSKLSIMCGEHFAPQRPMAESWSDWTMTFSEEDGSQSLLTTLAHGVPFTWVEMKGIEPAITATATGNDGADNRLRENVKVAFCDAAGNTLGSGAYSQLVVRIYNNVTEDLYGIYLPAGTTVSIADGTARLKFGGERQFVVVALLKSTADLDTYAAYAYSKPTDTKVAWNYSNGTLTTNWNVSAEDLRTGAATTDVLQGLLPHHYRQRYATYGHQFLGQSYATPRGKLMLAAANNLSISYKFSGMLPWYAVPTDESGDHPFLRDRMMSMIQQYAKTGTFGNDTYWGGKGLTQMALNMTFAREMGDEQLFRSCHDRLKEALVNWLTWTPGEDNFFFAYDSRYHGLIGYNTSYDSDTYNDHHFHYGYFTLAAALLALVDDDFRVGYGDMIRLVARDYANYKRDSWSCFLRMMDPWAGHSYAGGMGDGAGNGQESTSESMQGWGGLYLLGVALRDDEMRDAGIFGWVSESRATAEYWFDRHGEAVGNDFHTARTDDYNIDYSKFTHTNPDYTIPYSSNLTSHGVGWWTWFGGDPVFMQGIQWMPISPALDYLGEDKAFADWDYKRLMELKEHVGWQDYSGSDAWLGNSDWGNVVLSYRQWSDPDDAAAIFDQGWESGWPTMTTSSTNGITYYVTHSHRSWGDIDWSVTANYPTARTYTRNGQKTHIAYNPTDAEITVVYSDGTVLAVPARQMKVEGVSSTAFNYVYPVDDSEPDLRERLVMRNLALQKPCTSSSEENAGTVKANATDGDTDTRWGSAHKDNEWLQVDLGVRTSIYKVRVKWESAFASEYRIEFRDSEDGEVVYSKTGTGKSNDWTELLMDDRSCRYVRVVGVQRGTQYGTSFYELEVYGQPETAAATDLMGVEIASDRDVLKQGEPATLTVQGYDYARNPMEVVPVWSSTDGTFSGNEFTPSVAGKATVTAVIDGMTVSKELPVEEGLHLTSMELNVPGGVVVGKPYQFSVEGKDQFGAPMAANPTYTSTLSIDSKNKQLTATAQGVHTITARQGDIQQTRELIAVDGAPSAPETLSDKVPVFVRNELTSMNFTYNGGSQQVGDAFWLTDDCRTIYVKQLGTFGFGALGNQDLKGANMLHADIYPLDDAPQFSVHIEGAPGNREYAKALKGGQWNSIDLPITNTTVNWLFFAFSNYQAGTGSALVANVYFYTESGNRIYVGEPDSRGLVTVTTFGSGLDDTNAQQFLADVAALPSKATAIDLSSLPMNNSVPMNIATPNNPNTIIILKGSGGDDHAASDQLARIANRQNIIYDAGGWALPLEATDFKVVFSDGYPVYPVNFGRQTTLTYSRTIAAGEYATVCLPRELPVPDGLEAYELSAATSTAIEFVKATGLSLHPYVPYVVRNVSGADVTLKIDGTKGNVELGRGVGELTVTKDGVSLTGNFRQLTAADSEGRAALRKNGTVAWLSSGTVAVGAFQAYLSGLTDIQSKTLSFGGDIVTGITEVEGRSRMTDGTVYNLSGQRVAKPSTGVYIRNGKKMIVR